MTVFITGATGFIGEVLAHRLANEGSTVHVLVRNPQKAKERLTHPNIKLYKGDVTDYTSCLEATKDCQQAYHLAAQATVWTKDPAQFYDVNVIGTVNVLNACKENGVKRVVFVSTAATFGPAHAPHFSPIHENTDRRVDFFARYETTKFIAEERCLQFSLQGLEVVIVNPTRVFGPGELTIKNGVTMLIADYLYKKRTFIPGKGNDLANYIYVDDVVKGMVLAMERGRSGEKYLLAGQNFTFMDIFQMVQKETGLKNRIVKVPYGILYGLCHLEKVRYWLTGKEIRVVTSWVDKYQYQWPASNEKAVKELGFKPLDVEEGLRLTLEWLRKVRGEFRKSK